jgi:hypothetical protein
MPTTDWTFLLNGTTNFNSYVLSANIKQGRENYLDNYDGGSIAITINNTANYANNFAFNTKILVNYNSSAAFKQIFYVQNIDFNDYPGNTGLSTATIFAVDALGRSGRIQATAFGLTQANTINQLQQFDTGNVLPTDIVVSAVLGGGDSIASAQTYTGTVLNQINLINATERGVITTTAGTSAPFNSTIAPMPRSNLYSAVTSFSFGRTTSSTVIAYSSFDRIQNGSSFINTATISPLGLSPVTETNSASVSTYGPTFYGSSTVDYNTTQATGNADWISNTFSNPASLRFVITFTDKMQNSTALDNFESTFFQTIYLIYSLAYRVPGDVSDTTVQVVREGWQINITPSQTSFTLFFSPLNYYSFFTLDSSSLGILDTSRLGW